MDLITQQQLKRYGKEAPLKGLFKKEDTWKEYRERLLESSKGRPLKQKEMVKRYIDRPEFHKNKEVVDKDKAKKVEKYYEDRIKQDIRVGRIKPAQMDNQRRKFLELSQR